jgi:hypothetical protein
MTDINKDSNKQNALINIEKLGDMIKYTCKLSDSYLIFMMFSVDEYILLHETNLNWNEPKLAINLLNFSFNDIKKYNFNNFRYYVCMLEMEYIDIKKWTIVMQDEFQTMLECEIKDAFDNIMEGFHSS